MAAILIGPSHIIYMISIFSKSDHLDFSKRVLHKLDNVFQEKVDKEGWERILDITKQQVPALGLQSQIFLKLFLALTSAFIAFVMDAVAIGKSIIPDAAAIKEIIKNVAHFLGLNLGDQSDVTVSFVLFVSIMLYIFILAYNYFYFSYKRSHAYSIIGLFCHRKLEEIAESKKASSIPLSRRLGCHMAENQNPSPERVTLEISNKQYSKPPDFSKLLDLSYNHLVCLAQYGYFA
uniref:Uncharacterized protein n=1 Tax=Candidatus Kentrum sp. FM TaxID=2126340 RepID=A0A450SMF3_9GAMM|nr:MAG: hypothetical protein BECKFM1743C_GA0114222_101461 [Candidatus Kentron sp. FM]VFJ55638.1 MAG: hypothetical protein BECKFM1743A_GA0114220_101521 [Candidatus Kentron sp. FM]VFK10719.1 MAG: hypothetical protein BECKFM1743B_GA0114221_101521 [Candidatus Kentron sp. FM]